MLKMYTLPRAYFAIDVLVLETQRVECCLGRTLGVFGIVSTSVGRMDAVKADVAGVVYVAPEKIG